MIDYKELKRQYEAAEDKEKERQRQRRLIEVENFRRSLEARRLSKEQIDREVRDYKIDAALMDYRRENMLGPGQMTAEGWTQVYKNAGMTDEEIAAYREELSKYAAALDDPVDAYRS